MDARVAQGRRGEVGRAWMVGVVDAALALVTQVSDNVATLQQIIGRNGGETGNALLILLEHMPILVLEQGSQQLLQRRIRVARQDDTIASRLQVQAVADRQA
ncbi:hypothetical protein D3C85_1230960 [compost metagenome]